ncbi:MAG: ParB/RepB/Spo0J family partition protein [Epsilonproteobacteria bacterium]|nr:ParB/RepB/Spo0J family partition protein [Campylobacterota bacterium]
MGKGLSALIPDIDKDILNIVRIDKILPNPFQPRREFNVESLKQLSETIKKEGILEPVLLRKIADKYQIIAGERRIRAAKLAKISTVPAIIKFHITDVQMAKFALIENLQREELTCVEQAQGYKKLIDKFGYNQQTVAEIVGKQRATIANLLRVLNLPSKVIDLLQRRSLSLGHAKVLLSVSDSDRQIFLAVKAAKKQLSIRSLQNEINRTGKHENINRDYRVYEEKLVSTLNLPVRITGNRITIRFNDDDELEKIVKRFSEV